MSEQPDPPADDDLSDPDASHGSDLDPRVDSDEAQPEQTLGADQAGAGGPGGADRPDPPANGQSEGD